MEERPPQPLRQEQLPLERSIRRRGGDETRYPRQGVTSDSPSPSSNRRCIIDSRRHQLSCVNTGSKSLSLMRMALWLREFCRAFGYSVWTGPMDGNDSWATAYISARPSRQAQSCLPTPKPTLPPIESNPTPPPTPIHPTPFVHTHDPRNLRRKPIVLASSHVACNVFNQVLSFPLAWSPRAGIDEIF